MASRSSTVFTIASATVLAGLVAYVAYFDYRRRNDADFRKKLRKEKKRVNKQAAQTSQVDGALSDVSTEELQTALAKIREEEVPSSPDLREQYFMSNVNLGEQLCVQGPMFYVPSALHFYRALRVYPSPVELIVIYQKTMPEPVFKIVVELTQLDVSNDSSEVDVTTSEPTAVEEEETSPVRSGPPSEASSQEWDQITDPASTA